MKWNLILSFNGLHKSIECFSCYLARYLFCEDRSRKKIVERETSTTRRRSDQPVRGGRRKESAAADRGHQTQRRTDF